MERLCPIIKIKEEIDDDRLYVSSCSDTLSSSHLGSDGTGSPTARSESPSDVDSNHSNESDVDDEIDVTTVDHDVIKHNDSEPREKTFWECYPGLVKFGAHHASPVVPVPYGYYGYQPFPFYPFPPPPPFMPIMTSPVPFMTSPLAMSPPVPLNLSTPKKDIIPSPTTSEEESNISKLEKFVCETGSGNTRKRKLDEMESPVSRHGNRSEPRKYRCDVCGKCFSRSNTLVTHKRIHTGDKPFSCDMCGRAFRQPGNLTRHRLTHTPVKPFPCPICGKAFNRASNLQTHMRTHSKVRPFGCVTCGEAFINKDDLKVHMNTHEEERNFHCNICGLRFKQMSHLSQHMTQHGDVIPRRHGDVSPRSDVIPRRHGDVSPCSDVIPRRHGDVRPCSDVHSISS